ncbi:MAG: hypothetical protein H6716_25200 [Polyangiaceae bacterium]|nr:hypothetical protein [Polyangiaceae bacterium]
MGREEKQRAAAAQARAKKAKQRRVPAGSMFAGGVLDPAVHKPRLKDRPLDIPWPRCRVAEAIAHVLERLAPSEASVLLNEIAPGYRASPADVPWILLGAALSQPQPVARVNDPASARQLVGDALRRSQEGLLLTRGGARYLEYLHALLLERDDEERWTDLQSVYESARSVPRALHAAALWFAHEDAESGTLVEPERYTLPAATSRLHLAAWLQLLFDSVQPWQQPETPGFHRDIATAIRKAARSPRSSPVKWHEWLQPRKRLLAAIHDDLVPTGYRWVLNREPGRVEDSKGAASFVAQHLELDDAGPLDAIIEMATMLGGESPPGYVWRAVFEAYPNAQDMPLPQVGTVEPMYGPSEHVLRMGDVDALKAMTEDDGLRYGVAMALLEIKRRVDATLRFQLSFVDLRSIEGVAAQRAKVQAVLLEHVMEAVRGPSSGSSTVFRLKFRFDEEGAPVQEEDLRAWRRGPGRPRHRQ